MDKIWKLFMFVCNSKQKRQERDIHDHQFEEFCDRRARRNLMPNRRIRTQPNLTECNEYIELQELNKSVPNQINHHHHHHHHHQEKFKPKFLYQETMNAVYDPDVVSISDWDSEEYDYSNSSDFKGNGKKISPIPVEPPAVPANRKIKILEYPSADDIRQFRAELLIELKAKLQSS